MIGSNLKKDYRSKGTNKDGPMNHPQNVGEKVSKMRGQKARESDLGGKWWLVCLTKKKMS